MHLLILCRLLSAPASSAQTSAQASGQVVEVDVHKAAEKESEVEELNVTQEGKQATQF